jgi:hypothetical protein
MVGRKNNTELKDTVANIRISMFQMFATISLQTFILGKKSTVIRERMKTVPKVNYSLIGIEI